METLGRPHGTDVISSNANRSQEEEDVGDEVVNEMRDLDINEESNDEESERGSMETSTTASSEMIQQISTQPLGPSSTSNQPAEPASTSIGN